MVSDQVDRPWCRSSPRNVELREKVGHDIAYVDQLVVILHRFAVQQRTCGFIRAGDLDQLTVVKRRC